MMLDERACELGWTVEASAVLLNGHVMHFYGRGSVGVRVEFDAAVPVWVARTEKGWVVHEVTGTDLSETAIEWLSVPILAKEQV